MHARAEVTRGSVEGLLYAVRASGGASCNVYDRRTSTINQAQPAEWCDVVPIFFVAILPRYHRRRPSEGICFSSIHVSSTLVVI
jgi:hypothetical protein